MSLFDKTIFKPEFFQHAHAQTMKVMAGDEVLVRPAVLGLSLTMALVSGVAGGGSVSLAGASGVSDLVAVTIRSEAGSQSLPVESTLTANSFRQFLLEKHGQEGLRAKLRDASAALRRNADAPDLDSEDVARAVRGWISS